MKDRCNNERSREYHNYGGRGITVCKQWLVSFETFFKDVGPRPSGRHSLERRNNDEGYEPNNVYWALPQQQTRNTRRNRWVTLDNRTQTLTEWIRELDVPVGTFYYYTRQGEGTETALLRLSRQPILEALML